MGFDVEATVFHTNPTYTDLHVSIEDVEPISKPAGQEGQVSEDPMKVPSNSISNQPTVSSAMTTGSPNQAII